MCGLLRSSWPERDEQERVWNRRSPDRPAGAASFQERGTKTYLIDAERTFAFSVNELVG